MAGQKNDGKKKAWNADVPGYAGHSPALARLSLVGLLPSRARLRFTRRRHYILCIQPVDAKPAKRAHRLTTTLLRQTTSVHLSVLTRPSVAGSNAPRDSWRHDDPRTVSRRSGAGLPAGQREAAEGQPEPALGAGRWTLGRGLAGADRRGKGTFACGGSEGMTAAKRNNGNDRCCGRSTFQPQSPAPLCQKLDPGSHFVLPLLRARRRLTKFRGTRTMKVTWHALRRWPHYASRNAERPGTVTSLKT